jgi:hypothetical protein
MSVIDERNRIKEIDVCGVVLPNVPLSNIQLIDAAKTMKIHNFRGVYLRDELSMTPKDNECAILNLDDSSGSGTHWVAWIKKRTEKYYFDGYGLPPPDELLTYLHRPVYYNSERIQPDNEVFCGHLCLYVLKMVGDGMNFQEVINSLH